MNKAERRNLKTTAADALGRASGSPHKIALIHSAASAGLALAIAGLHFVLEQQIAGTGGLSGIGNRAMLETLQSLLQIAQFALIPFWEMGLLFVFLSASRHQAMETRDLTAGFVRFGPVFGGKLLQVALLFSAGTVGCYAGALAFSFSPFSNAFYKAAEPYLATGTIDYAALLADEAVMASMVWMIPFALAGMLVLLIPTYYRLRLMDYVLLDQPEKGAFHALRASRQLMQGKRFDLFKLDLSFWWFYLLELLVTAICYGDMILPALGVDLGISADAAYFAFYALALVFQMGLYAWKKPYLLTTYATYYDSLLPKEEAEQ